jgi:hypothetical protein
MDLKGRWYSVLYGFYPTYAAMQWLRFVNTVKKLSE